MLKFQDEKKTGLWREQTRPQAVSGISQKQFCTRTKLYHARIGYRRRRLAAGKAAKNSAVPDRLFVPVSERVGALGLDNRPSLLKSLYPTGVSLECPTIKDHSEIDDFHAEIIILKSISSFPGIFICRQAVDSRRQARLPVQHFIL